MSMPFCSACTPFALETRIGRVPFAVARCEGDVAGAAPFPGDVPANKRVVLAAAVPASEVRKNLLRDHELIMNLSKTENVCE
jgi:hypothetical protein